MVLTRYFCIEGCILLVFKQKVGAGIKKYRKMAKLTQAQLAEKIEIGTNYLSRIERGEKLPGLENFVKIANTIDFSPNQLLEEVFTSQKKEFAKDISEEIEKLSSKNQYLIDVIVKALRKIECDEQ